MYIKLKVIMNIKECLEIKIQKKKRYLLISTYILTI